MKKIITFIACFGIFLLKRTLMLEDKFYILYQKFTKDNKYVEILWNEIRLSYSNKSRYYHTFSHLETIYNQLKPFQLTPTTEFSIFYHDVVYDIQERDNEEKSAILATQRLKELGVASEVRKKVSKLIIETKKHEGSSFDNALFLDADISIFGSKLEVYKIYMQNIRKEYSIYSDKEYREGRKEVLKRFLKKERLYISNYFYNLYEEKAHSNIKYELTSL
jgi:predicted metal-dependent HD superfamily phosphohydrolase